jgi:HSP20 family protein
MILIAVQFQETEVKAAMDNGILTVTFPKSTPEQAPKKIAIS